jgi:hypothetical protein
MGFHLVAGSGQIYYQYRCDTHSNIDSSNSYIGYTSFESNGNGGTNYLDRHQPRCNSSYILQGFKLETGSGTMRYRYNCVKFNNQKTCAQVYTIPTTGSYNVWYLDRQYVEVDYKTFLQGFQIQCEYASLNNTTYVTSFWHIMWTCGITKK